MLRKFLDWQLSLFDKGSRLHKLRPLVSAVDAFFYEVPNRTRCAPHIRDSADAKRWMILVVIALLPAIIMAIWNTGVQKLVFISGSPSLMNEYLTASASFSGYFEFCFARWGSILSYGLAAFLPIMLLSYIVGGLVEGFFAVVRGHEIAEGYLVTGMLYALILPPTIPYWMVIFGVVVGIVIGKELFGGTGMNILNPALTCRVFLFFTFPGQMTGEIWAGTNPTIVDQSLQKMNAEAKLPAWEGFTQASPLGRFNVGTEVKRIHVDAIASHAFDQPVSTSQVIADRFSQWTGEDTLQAFVTGAPDQGGLGLLPDSYASAYQFAELEHGIGHNNSWNFFFGNQLGSLGETSTIACLLGAFLLIYTGIGAWRTMAAFGIGAYLTALIFEFFSKTVGPDGGAWNPAKYAFPAYKHLILGGLAFGLVFMATDPVSSPGMKQSKWFYGIFIGVVTLLIRIINPAYPEGVMLAILLGNVFAPIIDNYVLRFYRRRRRVQPA